MIYFLCVIVIIIISCLFSIIKNKHTLQWFILFLAKNINVKKKIQSSNTLAILYNIKYICTWSLLIYPIVPLSMNLNCDVSLFKTIGYFWKSHKTLIEILSLSHTHTHTHTHKMSTIEDKIELQVPGGLWVPLEALWKADDLIWGKRKWEQKRTLSQMLRRYSICTEALLLYL